MIAKSKGSSQHSFNLQQEVRGYSFLHQACTSPSFYSLFLLPTIILFRRCSDRFDFLFPLSNVLSAYYSCV
jgi:hypothetical protein